MHKQVCLPSGGCQGLRPIIIRKDMAQRAPFRTPTRVSRTSKSSSPWSVTSLLVSLFLSALLPWLNLPMTEQAWSRLSANQTSVCFSKETPDCKERQELRRGPTDVCKMPSN